VGIVDDASLNGSIMKEDSRAEVDMNVVMTANGHLSKSKGHGGGARVSGKREQDL